MPSPATRSADLLIEAGWVLPVAGSVPALADHAVAIEDGRILAVGPAAQLAERFEARERLSRPRHALLPGLVDAHSRAETLLRRRGRAAAHAMAAGPAPVYAGAALVADGGLTAPPALALDASSAAELSRDDATLAIAAMLLGGITAFGTQSPYPDEVARVAARARVRASIGLPVAEARTAWAEGATGHLARAESLWDEYASNPWVRFHFAPDPERGASDALLARVRTIADELDARIALPFHRSAAEVRASLARDGNTPAERLHAMGLLRPGFIALYGNHLDGRTLELAARTGISIVACPRESLGSRFGLCPIAELLARDAAVAIGTGSPSQSLPIDLLAEARAAALLSGGAATERGAEFERAASAEREPLAAERALELATLAGAKALGLDPVVGSIEPGKAADLIAVDLDSIECQCASSPSEAVLFAATRDRITDVWIDGRARVAQGRLLAFDEAALIDLARRCNGPAAAVPPSGAHAHGASR